MKRRTLSCALCRKRKVKCDLTSVPCNSCVKLGAPCSGGDVDVSNPTTIRPRSLFLWLQDEVNNFTTEPLNITNTDRPCVQDRGARDPSSLTEALAEDFRFSHIGPKGKAPLPMFILHSAARLPSATGVSTEAQISSSGSTTDFIPGAETDPLQMIPRRVVDFLLEAYISRGMQSYPIFHEPWLRSCFESVMLVYGSETPIEQSPTPYQLFTVNLVTAIALSTAARAKQRQARDMALRLFLHASIYLPEVLTNDLAGLQALLLIQVYALMTPAAANVYFLCGCSMQMCIELGLHMENDLGSTHKPEDDMRVLDLKRRIMWTAWEIDASCTGSLARPLTLYPADISTPYPSEYQDAAIHATYVDTTGLKSKFICAEVRQFRIIETEVIKTLYRDGTFLTSSGFSSWAAEVERRIQAWRDSIQTKALANIDISLAAPWDEMVVFSEIAAPLVIATLFRPSARGPAPSVPDLLKALDASVQIARGYLKQADMAFGSPKYTFQPCHQVFSAAMLFLHVLREHTVQVVANYSEDDVREFMAVFSEFFCETAERWPGALQCRDEYERLLSPLKEVYASATQAYLTAEGSQPPEEPLTAQPSLLGPLYETFEFPEFLLDPTMDIDADHNFADADSNVSDWERYFNFEN